LKRDPDNNSLKVSIAYIYAMSGDTDKAVKIYTELVEKNLENDEYMQNLIAVYIAKKDYETSVKYFETFQQTFPDNKNGEKIQQELEKLRKELYPEEEATEEGTEEK
jgi:tetratricopeptide (TPR) repeat protein